MNMPYPRQNGVALVVSLIMLVLITLLAVTAFRMGKNDLQIAGNIQQREQAFAATQGAIETTISTIQFTMTPTTPLPAAAGGFTNTLAVDTNGDGLPDLNVTVGASCVSIQPIPMSALNFSDPNDAGCTIQTNQSFGVVGTANNNSMCSNSLWDIQGSAANASYVIDEGTAVRVSSTTVCP